MKEVRLNSIEDIPDANARLGLEACRKLRLSGDGLDPVLKSSKLPVKLRNELRYAKAAEEWLSAPKLARQIDLARVQLAHVQAQTFLERVNPKRDRERYWLGVATVIIVNLTIFFSLLAMFIRGQV